MNRKMLKGGWSCCALAVLGLAGQSLGAGLVYEGFSYPAGSPIPGLGGCCGWAGAWTGSGMMINTPPSLTYPIGLPSSGLSLWNTAVGEAWRPFSGGGPLNNLGTDLWISFMELTQAPGTRSFVSLDSSGGALPSIVVDKDPLGNIVLSTAGFSTPAIAGRGPGNVDFIVVHLTQFSGGFSRVELYLNPTAWPVAAPTASLPPIPTPFSLGRFYWRSDAQQVLDEIRIGTLPGDVAAGTGGGCYANCDQSTSQPCLNVLDFACFLNRFAAGDTWANCDGSTTGPVLNVLDFACFLNKFAAGCSTC